MPIISRPLDDGRYSHRCSKCGVGRVNKYPRYAFTCDCPPAVQREPFTPPALPPLRAAAARDERVVKLPCAYLGPPTGKRHKVGCVDRYLDEHACYCGERLREVKETSAELRAKRPGTPTHRVITPVAIPGGRCRDLAASRGEISCLDCPHYRAGLLAGPAAD